MGVQAKRTMDNYSEYSRYELSEDAIEYALTDALILKEALTLKAEDTGHRKIVTVGMSNYRVPYTI